jgi:hypothetical protein
MNLNPGNDKLVFLGRDAASKHGSIRDGIYRDFPLTLSMDVWNMVFVGIMEEQPDKNPVKYRNSRHGLLFSQFQLPKDSDSYKMWRLYDASGLRASGFLAIPRSDLSEVLNSK